MATTTPDAFGDLRARAATPLGGLATAAILAALGLAVTAQLPTPTPVSTVAVVGVLAASVWMLCSERYEWTLVVLMLYLGLADGVLKLVTDSQPVTLVRDLLFFAIVIGAMIRMIVRRQPLVLPPLSGWATTAPCSTRSPRSGRTPSGCHSSSSASSSCAARSGCAGSSSCCC
jgi:hypothetical protein